MKKGNSTPTLRKTCYTPCMGQEHQMHGEFWRPVRWEAIHMPTAKVLAQSEHKERLLQQAEKLSERPLLLVGINFQGGRVQQQLLV